MGARAGYVLGGKPLVEASSSSKATLKIREVADLLLGAVASEDDEDVETGDGKSSLMEKFGGLLSSKSKTKAKAE